jgi:hypothetical protein
MEIPPCKPACQFAALNDLKTDPADENKRAKKSCVRNICMLGI